MIKHRNEDIVVATGCGLGAVLLGIVLSLLFWGGIIWMIAWAVKSIWHL
jgi:hypothetical protein